MSLFSSSFYNMSLIIYYDNDICVSSLCYGHKSSTGTVRRLFHTKIVRFYGGRKNRTIFYQFLEIVRCPVKFKYYLKFHGAHTAFARVIEVNNIGRAQYSVRIGRASGDFCLKLYRTISTVSVWALYDAWPGIVRCLTSARNFYKSLNQSADARSGTGRPPSGHRPMFYESKYHR